MAISGSCQLIISVAPKLKFSALWSTLVICCSLIPILTGVGCSGAPSRSGAASACAGMYRRSSTRTIGANAEPTRDLDAMLTCWCHAEHDMTRPLGEVRKWTEEEYEETFPVFQAA